MQGENYFEHKLDKTSLWQKQPKAQRWNKISKQWMNMVMDSQNTQASTFDS